MRVGLPITRLFLASLCFVVITPRLSAEPVPSPAADALAQTLHPSVEHIELPLAPDVLPDGTAPPPAIPPAPASGPLFHLQSVGAYQQYINTLHRQLKNHWKPREVRGRTGGRTVVNFQVEKTGKLVQLAVIESSGNKQADDKAVEAVHQAEPFPVFPRELPMESLVVQYTFDFYKPF